MSPVEDKLRNPKIEEALVGAVLINPEAFPGLSAWLAPADFHLQHLRILWQAMTDLQTGGTPLDLLTLSSRLEERDLLDQVGGPAYLTRLLNAPVTSLNVGGYARKVKELSLRRQKLEDATLLAQQAVDFELPPGADPLGLDLPTRFTVRSAADALRPQPPLEWVVEKVIPRASLSLFYGEPGAKKTYSMLSLAVCAASGRPWLGMRTRPVGVLVVDEESGEQRLSLRIAAALRGELCGAATPLEYVCLSGLRLDDPGEVVLLQELIASRGAGLVILDALADLTCGDENAKQDMQPVFNRLRGVAEATGAALVLVHHANKLGGYRGSSVIKGAVDLMVQVQSEQGSDYISFKSEKNRDGESLRWSARARWVDSDPPQFYLEEAPAALKGKAMPKSHRYILRYLQEHGPSSVGAMVESCDSWGVETMRKAIQELARTGKVCRSKLGDNRRSRVAYYQLTAEADANNG